MAYPWTAHDILTAADLNAAIKGIQNPPRCYAYQGAAQTLTTGVLTAVTMDGEITDTDGMHSTVTNNSRLTIVTAGRYRVFSQVAFVSNATGYRTVTLRKNGTDVAFTRANAVNGIAHIQQTYNEILCVAGDYLETAAQQTSGGNLNLTAASNATFIHAVWCGTT